MKKTPALVATSIIVLGLATLSCYKFGNFSPTAKQTPQKEKEKTEKAAQLPLTEDAEIIGETSTAEGKSVTFKTEKSIQETQNFYYTILEERGWEKEEELQNGLHTIEYKKEEERIKVTAGEDSIEEKTLVVIAQYKAE